MHSFKYKVSFRIVHPNIDPDDLCQKLNLDAKRKWRVGDQKKTPKGNVLKGVYNYSYCVFELNCKCQEIDLIDYLRNWNKKLFIHKALLNQIHDTGGKLEYFIGWFSDENSGEEFNVDFLSELAELKIGLSFDFYG